MYNNPGMPFSAMKYIKELEKKWSTFSDSRKLAPTLVFIFPMPNPK